MTNNKQYPELPTHFMLVQESFRDEVYLYTADQMRAYADSWLQAYIQKKAESPTQPAAPASQDAEDAARYRYLKKYKTWDSTDVFYWLRCAPADEVDSIIDAARGAQGESNG